MKKLGIISILVLVVGITSVISFFILSNLMLVRTPVLVHKNPKITFFVGKVDFRPDETSDWRQVEVGQSLKEDCEIKTDKRSLIDISFHDNTAIRVEPDSYVKLHNLDIRKLSIHIKNGKVYGKFSKLFKNHEIEVSTPTSVAAIRGTDLGFEVNEVIEKLNDDKSLKSSKKRPVKKGEEGDNQFKHSLVTTVYAITGITEVYNPAYPDDKILLSYQNKVNVKENEPVSSPEPMNSKEINSIRKEIDVIHDDEVLLISHKILFKSGSAKILNSSNDELDKIAEIIKDKDVVVRIDGHTDSTSTPSYNYKLSIVRAKAIRSYLVQKGIKLNKLKIKGYGESRPIADNISEEGRKLNRRVEFILIE